MPAACRPAMSAPSVIAGSPPRFSRHSVAPGRPAGLPRFACFPDPMMSMSPEAVRLRPMPDPDAPEGRESRGASILFWMRNAAALGLGEAWGGGLTLRATVLAFLAGGGTASAGLPLALGGPAAAAGLAAGLRGLAAAAAAGRSPDAARCSGPTAGFEAEKRKSGLGCRPRRSRRPGWPRQDQRPRCDRGLWRRGCCCRGSCCRGCWGWCCW